MKKLFLIVAIAATALTQKSFAQEIIKLDPFTQLLNSYYSVKNALVAGSANVASTNALAFVEIAKSIDKKIISEENMSPLVKAAGKISNSNDIKKQREDFAGFSTNMAMVAKAVKLTDQPIYQAYCPMKKAYWLSSEPAIKNPYFGNAMLTCGKITETIK